MRNNDLPDFRTCDHIIYINETKPYMKMVILNIGGVVSNQYNTEHNKMRTLLMPQRQIS